MAGRSRPGRGGVNRGRGDAELGYLGNTPAETEGLAAKRLPPTATPSREWTTIRSGRAEPEVDPVREGGVGGAADAGAGEAAWTRDLAPRHRRVVERFFGPTPPRAAPGSGK